MHWPTLLQRWGAGAFVRCWGHLRGQNRSSAYRCGWNGRAGLSPFMLVGDTETSLDRRAAGVPVTLCPSAGGRGVERFQPAALLDR